MWADQSEQLEPRSQGWWWWRGETGQIMETEWTELSPLGWVGVKSEKHKCIKANP